MSDAETRGERETQPDFRTMNVWQRINAVDRMLSEAPWRKDQSNDTYKSVTIDQIRDEVSKAESDAGIVAHYCEEAVGHYEHNGRQLCMIKARITYVNIDNPDDRAVFVRTGFAQDSGDKGWNKCESIIYKNLYKGLYHIGDREEDPDSISNNEAELLAVFRCEKFHGKLEAFVQANLPEVRRLEQEQRDAEARKRREAKAKAAAGGFFAKPEPKPEPVQTQEQAVAKAIGEDAEFLDAEAISEVVKARRDSVNVKDARVTLAKFRAADPGNEILNAYIDRHGKHIGQWEDSKVVDCYLDLLDSGVSL